MNNNIIKNEFSILIYIIKVNIWNNYQYFKKIKYIIYKSPFLSFFHLKGSITKAFRIILCVFTIIAYCIVLILNNASKTFCDSFFTKLHCHWNMKRLDVFTNCYLNSTPNFSNNWRLECSGWFVLLSFVINSFKRIWILWRYIFTSELPLQVEKYLKSRVLLECIY